MTFCVFYIFFQNTAEDFLKKKFKIRDDDLQDLAPIEKHGLLFFAWMSLKKLTEERDRFWRLIRLTNVFGQNPKAWLDVKLEASSHLEEFWRKMTKKRGPEENAQGKPQHKRQKTGTSFLSFLFAGGQAKEEETSEHHHSMIN